MSLPTSGITDLAEIESRLLDFEQIFESAVYQSTRLQPEDIHRLQHVTDIQLDYLSVKTFHNK